MVSVQDQTGGGHRAKATKKTANTKCQQMEEYHPVCLSHCGVKRKKNERRFQGLHQLTGGAAVNKGGGIKRC